MGTMTDLVYRCLACNEIAYEIDADYVGDPIIKNDRVVGEIRWQEEKNKVYALYKCPNCGFSWEVFSCD